MRWRRSTWPPRHRGRVRAADEPLRDQEHPVRHPRACQPSCKPSLQGELTAIYKGPAETLRVVGGAAVGGSNNPITAGGVIDTFVDVALPEFSSPPSTRSSTTPRRPRFTRSSGRTGRPPETSTTSPPCPCRGTSKRWWFVETQEPTVLRSIVSNADLFDDGAYVSFVPTPGQLQVRDVTSLVMSFEWGRDDARRLLELVVRRAPVSDARGDPDLPGRLPGLLDPVRRAHLFERC